MGELTFQELRKKQVVNITDGRCLGNLCDMVFEKRSGKILGIVVPGNHKIFCLKAKQDIFISYHSICKIGQDTILVDVTYKKDDYDCNLKSKDNARLDGSNEFLTD